MRDRGSVIQMQLQNDTLTLIASAGSDQNQSVAGSVSNIRGALGPVDVTEAKLEVAIAQVEDLIMPILRLLPPAPELEIGGAELAELFRLLSANAGEAISIEAVEGLFNQLADHAAGSPVAWRQPLSPAHVALGLVVLREVMHHGGYRSVSLLARAG